MSQNSLHSYTQDEVAVYAEFEQVFTDARPIAVSPKPEAKLMEHPVEDGTVVTDHKVDQPVEIELNLVIAVEQYRDVYAEIKELYTEGTFLTVQTRADTYEQLVIESMPHEETPEMATALSISLRLKEVKTVETQTQALPPGKVKNPSQSDTQNRGEVQPQESKGSWAGEMYDNIYGKG